MNIHPLLSFIRKYTACDEQNWQRVAEKIELKTYKKGDFLLKAGQICSDLYFLETGVARFFYVENGVELNKFFVVEPYLFTSQESFYQQKVAAESIQILENAQIWKMQRKDAYELLNYPFWAEFVRLLTQEVQKNTETILQALQSQTAANRYKNMILSDDIILKKVPLKYLSTYLGIAAPSLSRIRKKMLG